MAQDKNQLYKNTISQCIKISQSVFCSHSYNNKYFSYRCFSKIVCLSTFRQEPFKFYRRTVMLIFTYQLQHRVNDIKHRISYKSTKHL